LYLELYPDIIFIINFGIDFILLLLLRLICKRSTSKKRLLLAAAAGGLVAAIVGVFPWMNVFIRFIIMTVISSVIMLLIAYGRMDRAQFIRLLVSLYLLTYFMGGLINSIYYYTSVRIRLHKLGSILLSNLSWKSVLLCFILAVPLVKGLLWLFRIISSKERDTLDTELILGEMRVATRGLVDTGNCLYDPVFKKPVIIVENGLLMNLMPEEQYQKLLLIKKMLADRNEMDNDNPDIMNDINFKIRFIPYQSVGRQKGILLGLVLDKVLIRQGKDAICNEKVTAAIYDDALSKNDDYHVILHKGLL